MKRLMMTTAAGLFMAAPAAYAITAEELVAEYQAADYDFIEVTEGISQIKVEATRDGQTIEVIYDAETGEILKSEQEAADAEHRDRTGVQVRSRARDFLDADDLDDEDDEDDHDENDDEDDHDENDHDENDDERGHDEGDDDEGDDEDDDGRGHDEGDDDEDDGEDDDGEADDEDDEDDD